MRFANSSGSSCNICEVDDELAMGSVGPARGTTLSHEEGAPGNEDAALINFVAETSGVARMDRSILAGLCSANTICTLLAEREQGGSS